MGIHWLIITTILIVLAQSYIFTKWGLKRIHYSRFFSEKAVFEEEELELVEVISNKKLLPVPWLRLESRISANLQFESQSDLNIVDEQFHRSLFSLKPYEKITRRHKVRCKKRGYYWFKTVALKAGDPFGIENANQTYNVFASVIVYPKLIPMQEIPLPSNSWQGDIIVKRWIMDDPFVFAGVRDYSQGDSLRSVNWNATARTGELKVSKKDYTADHHLMIYLNFDLTEDIRMPIKDEAIIERGISYAASIAQSTLAAGISTGFGCNSYTIEPDQKIKLIKDSVRVEPNNGKGHLVAIFETLAKLKIDRSMNFHHFLKEDINVNRGDTDILIITATVSEKMQEHIHQLEVNGNSVEILFLDDNSQVGEQHAQ